jgi:hypothetical protein
MIQQVESSALRASSYAPKTGQVACAEIGSQPPRRSGTGTSSNVQDEASPTSRSLRMTKEVNAR